MSIRSETNKVRIQQWSKIIQQRCDSGLSITEFCKQNDLSKHKYYYWLRKIRTEAIKNMPAIVDVTPTDITTGNFEIEPVSQSINEKVGSVEPQIAIQKGDIKISVSSSISPQLLSVMMESLLSVK